MYIAYILETQLKYTIMYTSTETKTLISFHRQYGIGYESKSAVVIFDGTSHFTEAPEYNLGEDEEVVFSGSFQDCVDMADQLNDECYD